MNAFRSLLPRSSVFSLPLVLASTLGLAAPGLAAEQPADNWVSTLGVNGAAHAVARDSAGNVIAAGHQQAGPFVNDTHFAVAKWSAAGELLWQRRLETTDPWFDRGLAIEVDRGENIVAAGYATDATGRPQLTVTKWDPTGVLLWTRPIGHPVTRVTFPNNPAASLTLGGDGTAFVSGSAGLGPLGPLNPAGVVARVSLIGVVIWLYRNDVPNSRIDEFRRVAIDRRGDIYAAGGPGTMLLVKLGGSNGRRRWFARFGGHTGYSAGPEGLAVDRQGNVVLCGTAVNPQGNRPLEFAVARFHSALGQRLWGRFYGYGSAYSVAIGPKGEIVVGGRLGVDAFAVLKLSPARGETIWTRQFFGRESTFPVGARSVAFGPKGQIVAGGQIYGFLTGPDALVATWDRSGNLLWKQRLTSEVGSQVVDNVAEVAMDGGGGAAVAGLLASGSTSGFGAAVLKGWYTQPQDVQWESDAVRAGEGTASLRAQVEDPQSVREASAITYWSYSTFASHSMSRGAEGRLWGSVAVPPYTLFQLGFGQPSVLTRDLAGVLRVEDGGLLAATREPSGTLRYSPSSLAFPLTRVGKPRTLTLTFQNPGPGDLKIALERWSDDPFSWRIPGVPPPPPVVQWPGTIGVSPGTTVSLTVTFNPTGRGSFTGALRAWTTDPSHPRITIPITGKGQ